MEHRIEELKFLNQEKYHEKWKERKSQKRNYCPLPFEFYDQVRLLTDAQVGRLIMGIMEYTVIGEVPALEGSEELMFYAMKHSLDNFKEYYELQAEKRSQKAKKASDAAKAKRQARAAVLEDILRSQSESSDIHNTNTKSNTKSKTKTNSISASLSPSSPEDGDGGSHREPERDTQKEYDAEAKAEPRPHREQTHGEACLAEEDPEVRTYGETEREKEEYDLEERVSSETASSEEDGVTRAVRVVEDCCGRPVCGSQRKEIAGFVTALGEDRITRAAELAAQYGSRNWAYMKTILHNWQQNGIREPAPSGGYWNRNGWGYSSGGWNNRNMYCQHGTTKLSPLDREAIESALEEE